ncbi:unnamed protein product [Parnassius mnemosyne]|uniref:Reverse transcriptase domain-containing protein n=1 Tax=Parnassius mnemosyne TaxID=213953 RepID=A0AAV1MA01_9NEOP
MHRHEEGKRGEDHPLPTMNELLPKFKKAKYFSRLDINNAFYQLEIDKDSRYITTFSTSRGLFRYKRLMFGVSCAPEMFQKVLEKLLLGCEGTANFIDDIIIHGSDELEHDRRLDKVLRVWKENNVLLNQAKCNYKTNRIEFLGHQLTGKGVKPLDKYMKAIQSSKKSLQISKKCSFLGLVNYVGKWIPNLASLTEPLRKLIRLKLGKQNIADPISRLCESIHPVPFDNENYINAVVEYSRPIAVPLNEIDIASASDKGIAALKNGVFDNKWDECVNAYKAFQSEICFHGNIALRGSKIIIPKQLRERVLEAAHQSHI